MYKYCQIQNMCKNSPFICNNIVMEKSLLFLLKLIIIVSICFVLFGCEVNNNSNSSKTAFNYIADVANEYSPQFSHNDFQPNDSLPLKYDLRELGVVTPVKNQNPWNSCWGFAAIAAAETSILSSLNKTYDETKLDLSEKHLIWFSKSYVIDEKDSQYGEGLYYDSNDSFDSGGFTYTATSIFSSGTGVILDSLVPYQGNNRVIDNENNCFSKNDDWSVDEKYRYIQEYRLIESNVLPCPANRDNNGKYIGYNAYATECIKKELLSGRAVSICYHSEKGNEIGGTKYLNTSDNKWTHYTYDDVPYSHAVTIVGYDDSIPKEYFLDHSSDNSEANPLFPDGDGAWIVKNSWGAETESFPNNGNWGIKNDNGKATGYFYLSYYDKSLYGPESFLFEPFLEEGEYIINQYDFLQSKRTKSIYSKNEIKMANVFNNNIDKTIKAISVETCNENSDVNVKIYLLNSNYTKPNDGQLLLDSDYNFEYAGYHKINFDDGLDVKQGQLVSVVVTQMVNTDDGDYYEIFVDTQLKNDDDGKERAKGVVNRNESFLYIKDHDSWYDWSEIIELFSVDEQLGTYVYDNFPFKIFSDFTDNNEQRSY